VTAIIFLHFGPIYQFPPQPRQFVEGKENGAGCKRKLTALRMQGGKEGQLQ
jgi:hypothetical protein